MSTTDPEPKPTRSAHLGCVALVGVLVLGIVLVAISIFRLNAMVTEYESQFQGDDWTALEGKVVNEAEPIRVKTLIFAGEIDLHGASAEIAMLGGDATLHGQYDGDVHFLGRNLDIADDAVITGSLRIAAARHVTLRGTIKGEVVGHWDRLYGDKTAEPEAPPTP